MAVSVSGHRRGHRNGLAILDRQRTPTPALNRTNVLTSLTASQVSETIRLAQRGTDRTEDVTRFVDLRLGRRFKIGTSSFEPVLDPFNVLNANHVLLQTEQIGTTWGRPTRILTPRIIRFGVTARF